MGGEVNYFFLFRSEEFLLANIKDVGSKDISTRKEWWSLLYKSNSDAF